MQKVKVRFPKTRFFVEVFLWRTRDELHKKTREKGDKVDYGGIYKPEAYIIYPRFKVKNKLGEIHLYKGRTGAGLLSHEVLHCILDYAQKVTAGGTGTLDIDDDHHDDMEKLCFYQGETVRRIAVWLQKVKEW